MAHAPRKRANPHDPTTAAVNDGHLGEGSGDGLQRSDNDSAARTRHPDTVALDAVVKGAAAAVLLEEGVEGAEERHAHESSRSYCFGVPVTIASSSQASTRYSIT